MNKKRKEKLRAIHARIQNASDDLSSLYDEESDALANWPENLQGTDRYAECDDACDCISTAISSLMDASSALEEIF